ncbi:hypothetical protein Hanom_Chr11g01049201 [Helianthus anomalus]
MFVCVYVWMYVYVMYMHMFAFYMCVQVMRTQMVDLEARLEEERNLLTTRLNEERKAREELQQQLQEFMNNWCPLYN